MAQKVNEQKYEAMIAALSRFASNVSTKASEMHTLGSVCKQALGEGDEGAAKAFEELRSCQLKYLKATKQALQIAQAMQAELDAQRKEREIWNNDEVSE